MCGICGIVNFDGRPAQEPELRAMMWAMRRRGPNDNGVYIDDDLGLGHVRLSIIDLSAAGRQPMTSSDGRFVVIYNGEIYNYLELRKELGDGYRFRTKTDTEVLLAAYAKWGPDFLDRLNGMFALCIYDRLEHSIFLARDRFGIKPLYYKLEPDRLIFASEITALTTLGDAGPDPDYQAIYDFMIYNRTCYSDRTFFVGIKRLLHGETLRVVNGRLKLRRWYDLRQSAAPPFSEPDEFLHLFASAVDLNLRSDVPVGISLSGGLDSSAVCSVADKFHAGRLGPRFAAVYELGEPCDESRFLASYQGPDLHYIRPSGSGLGQDLADFVEALVEPVPGTSEYAEYKIMQEAKRHCTVLLTGQGADEQLAGYVYFFGFLFKQLLWQGRLGALAKEVRAYLQNHRSLAGLVYWAYFMLPPGLGKLAHHRSLSLLDADFAIRHQASDEIASRLYGSPSIREAVLNHFEYKLEHHLVWSDRSGMRFSMEARFPFLDHRLVEKMVVAPLEQVIGHGQTKLILRRAMEGVLPPEINARQDKIGFETPEDRWFRQEPLAGVCHDILGSTSFAQRGIISRRKALELWSRHTNNKVAAAAELWKMINLELWFRQMLGKHRNSATRE